MTLRWTLPLAEVITEFSESVKSLSSGSHECQRSYLYNETLYALIVYIYYLMCL